MGSHSADGNVLVLEELDLGLVSVLGSNSKGLLVVSEHAFLVFLFELEFLSQKVEVGNEDHTHEEGEGDHDRGNREVYLGEHFHFTPCVDSLRANEAHHGEHLLGTCVTVLVPEQG